MVYPMVQLVDKPETTATVLFDFNQDHLERVGPAAAGFTLGAPELLGDPRGVGAEWGLRTAQFRAVVTAGEQVAYSFLSDIARAMLRDKVYLFFQMSSSSRPVWAEVVRSAPEALSLDSVYKDRDTNRWVLDVNLLCEPFLLGERETLGGPVTVPNDPAADGGLFTVLPEIKGDAPAPLSIYNSTRWHSFGFAALTEVAPLWKQAESCALGLDTSAPVAAADPVMSGTGSTNYARITFGTPALANRITWNVNADVADDAVRRYLARVSQVRVLVFVRSTTGGDFTMRARSESDTVVTTGPIVSVSPATTTLRQAVDLGVVTIARSTGGDYPTDALWQVQIQAGRDSVSGSLDVDAIVLVPADRQLWFGQVVTGWDAPALYIDAEREDILQVTGGPDPAAIRVLAGATTPRGGFLHVSPGEPNVLTWQTGHGDFTTTAYCDVTHESALTLSYRPRWLWLAAD